MHGGFAYVEVAVQHSVRPEAGGERGAETQVEDFDELAVFRAWIRVTRQSGICEKARKS